MNLVGLKLFLLFLPIRICSWCCCANFIWKLNHTEHSQNLYYSTSIFVIVLKSMISSILWMVPMNRIRVAFKKKNCSEGDTGLYRREEGKKGKFFCNLISLLCNQILKFVKSFICITNYSFEPLSIFFRKVEYSIYH